MTTAPRVVIGTGGSRTEAWSRKRKMAEVVKVNLGSLGAKYLTSRLSEGGLISRSLLQLVKSVDNACSPLPDGTNSGASLQFERGGITTQGMTLRWLASDIAAKFPERSEICFLVEDTWAKPTDPVIHDNRHRVLIAGPSVYYAIPGTEADEGGFQQILRSVTSFEYAGFVASCRLLDGPKVSNLDSVLIAELAQHICMVLVSAFDREGVVISEIAAQASADSGPVVLG
jgi:hypothetical protein